MPHFVVARRFDAAVPVAGGEVGEPGRQLPNRPADAVRDEQQRRQRDQPDDRHEQEQRQREAAAQVARFERADQLARLAELRGQLLHVDAAQVARVDLHALRRRRM